MGEKNCFIYKYRRYIISGALMVTLFAFLLWLSIIFQSPLLRGMLTFPVIGFVFDIYKVVQKMEHEEKLQSKDHCLQIAINSDLVKTIDDKSKEFAEKLYAELKKLMSFMSTHGGVGEPRTSQRDKFTTIWSNLIQLYNEYGIWIDIEIVDELKILCNELLGMVKDQNLFSDRGNIEDSRRHEAVERFHNMLDKMLDLKGELADNEASKFKNALRERLLIDDAHAIRRYIFREARKMIKE